MKKYFVLLILLITSTVCTSNNEITLFSTTDYGSHLTTPFDMKHHVTTYMDTNTGYLYIAGDNRYYNLGNNTTVNSSLYFPAYKDGDSDQKFINPVDWDFEIYHSTIVDADGCLWVVGIGTSGMLATGNTSTVSQFTKVSVPDDLKVTKVCATRGYSTIIKLEDGSVWTIGNATTTGITRSTSEWVQVDSLLPTDDNEIIEFHGGANASLYLTNNGNLYTVGTSSQAGGTGSFTIPKLTDVCQIDLMYQTTFALKNDGTVWGTGANSSGQLGLGNTATKSEFTQANLTLLEDEFPVLLKGGILTGYFLTNLGNMYIAGSDAEGQYGDGSTNSSSTSFTLVHEDVAYFDVGEYQTGVLFKDSSLKFFGQNTLGQLGIGTTTNVYDAYSDDAKLVSPLAEGLGSGLIPAVTLATYTPDLSSWPSECVEDLTDEQIEEYSESSIPIRPGQEHEDGSTNTFIADDGGVYIFSSPDIINQDDISVSNIEFNSTDYITVFYNELNLDDGILEGYTVQINISANDNSFSNTFNYSAEQNNLENYPKQVGTYTITTTLLSKSNEVKTTAEISYEITNATYTPVFNDSVVNSLENLYIIKDNDNTDLFKQTILTGIKNGTFVSTDFVQVEGYSTQIYVEGDYSSLTTNEISIEFNNDITDSGNYIAYVTIKPYGYESSMVIINFTIDPSYVLIHNIPSISSDDITFNEAYEISTNNSILNNEQVLYIQFKKEDGTVVTEFEATDENLKNFNLYPKEAGNYIVVSIIKQDNIEVSTKEINFTIKQIDAVLINNSTMYIQEDNFDINDIINHYTKNNNLVINEVIVSTTTTVVNFNYVIEGNNYIVVITNSNNEVVENITKSDTYTISISLDNDNYNSNTINFTFDITINTFNPLILLIGTIPIILIICIVIKRKSS